MAKENMSPDDQKQHSFMIDFYDHIYAMEPGDVVLINRPARGDKWIISTISGDGYITAGFGATPADAWSHEI